MVKKYHMRRSEKQIRGRKRLLELLQSKDHVTIAMCKDNIPYLVTINHYFDKKGNCIYFHCASQGKKMDYMKANPLVWGQATEDLGPVKGECSWQYRTVMFSGKVKLVEGREEKKRALEMMIDKLCSRPGLERAALTGPSFDRVAVCRIDLSEMSGKESIKKKK
jgi:nitroimidazol reductase NimA-like FMN-containing flavoprotein (pyridoxamine 5'-phosphate oxidase superfamily)